MSSEQRLHPASILFAIGRSAKRFAVPGLLVLFAVSRSSGGRDGSFGYLPVNWEVWLMLLMVPSLLLAVVRYLSFRVRYEGTELVIRSGVIFRNERHIPYARIQNLDAVQNIAHRALGVIEVRVETGAGSEPEATISVLPSEAFAEMRRRVFEGGPPVDKRSEAASEPAPAAAMSIEARTLLRLPLRELLLLGLLENRGFVIIGAIYALVWEAGLLDGFWGRVFGRESYGGGMVRDLLRAVFSGDWPSPRSLALTSAGLAAALIVVGLASMAWAVVRLYGFRLTRVGEDLRTEFGLFTRVAATIPLRRVQTLTVLEGPLQRLVTRVSVRVETAGGDKSGTGASTKEREWLAPIIRSSAAADLVGEVLPGVDLLSIDWQPVDPRAFRRAVKPAVLAAIVMSGLAAWPLGWWALGVLLLGVPWAVIATHKAVNRMGWAATSEAVAFRSGWLWRSVTVARAAKIQAVTRSESPFDRRAAMARVRVDTAGAGERSRRVDVPYLSHDTAAALHSYLSRRAADTTFRW
jgi:putative membrane protein